MPVPAVRRPYAAAIACALAVATLGACATGPAPGAGVSPQAPGAGPGGTLRAFASEDEFAAHLDALVPKWDPSGPPRRTGFNELTPAQDDFTKTAQAATGAAESVTNVQHAGVDEGGIVKVHGDHLVMLRRGRLFTVAIGDEALRPVSAVDAFGPDIEPRGTWYDELLVSGDLVIVIGFSYARGGTEVGLFRIDRAGRLEHASTYHLRSNDYYSSRNYSSRLIDGKLVFYTPLRLPLHGGVPHDALPAIRRWGGAASEFQPLVPATRVYRSEQPLAPFEPVALHTVTVCDLTGGEMACEGTAVLGPSGRVFYVSPTSVYVWATGWRQPGDDEPGGSLLFRMPLDGGAPSALGVSGGPVDQFSFLESGDGHLNVLVRSAARGDGMWSAERAAGSVALLRVPLAAFGDGRDPAPPWRYRPLPPMPQGGEFRNRFVGDFLLYGSGSGWGLSRRVTEGGLVAVPWRGGDLVELTLPHGVDRIEGMGADAVVVGTDGRHLHFTPVRLGGGGPALADAYVMPDAAQGELRSHGFFYRSDGEDSGVLGLPVRGARQPGHAHLRQGSAFIFFLRNTPARFEELGKLAANGDRAVDDGCRASCVDWYGNARPLFLRGRVFALLGYELVEGRIVRGRIVETQRVDYAPRTGLTASGAADD